MNRKPSKRRRFEYYNSQTLSFSFNNWYGFPIAYCFPVLRLLFSNTSGSPTNSLSLLLQPTSTRKNLGFYPWGEERIDVSMESNTPSKRNLQNFNRLHDSHCQYIGRIQGSSLFSFSSGAISLYSDFQFLLLHICDFAWVRICWSSSAPILA